MDPYHYEDPGYPGSPYYVEDVEPDFAADAAAVVDEWDFDPNCDDYSDVTDEDRDWLVQIAEGYLAACGRYEEPDLEGPSIDPVLAVDSLDQLQQVLAQELFEIRRLRAAERRVLRTAIRMSGRRPTCAARTCSRSRAHRSRRRRSTAKSRSSGGSDGEPGCSPAAPIVGAA